MVIQRTINNLKEGPQEHKVAVARGVALSVVAVLFVVWAIFFFKNIQKGAPVDIIAEVKNELDFSRVEEAQKQLQVSYSPSSETSEQPISQQINIQIEDATSTNAEATTTLSE